MQPYFSFLLKIISKIYLFMCLPVLPHVCTYTTCVASAFRCQERVVSDPWELKLQMLVSHHMDAGSGNQISWESDSAPN